jgi:hypothetical protein
VALSNSTLAVVGWCELTPGRTTLVTTLDDKFTVAKQVPAVQWPDRAADFIILGRLLPGFISIFHPLYKLIGVASNGPHPSVDLNALSGYADRANSDG